MNLKPSSPSTLFRFTCNCTGYMWVGLLSILGWGACSHPPESKIQYSIVSKDTTSCLEGVDSTCITIELTYPTFEGANESSFEGLMQQYVYNFVMALPSEQDTFFTDTNDFMAQMVERFQSSAEEITPIGYMASWILNHHSEVTFNTNGIVSLRTVINNYTGGAHGMQTTTYRMFDVTRKQPLDWFEFIAPPHIGDFEELAEEKFRHHHNLSSIDDFSEEGFWFPENIFQLNDNVGLTDSGLVVHFNPYEVAAYAIGPTKLFFDWKTLSPWIREDYARRLISISR